jgi:6-pyruvoyltetrahydropterin/6-carboxytetrahydropterin synthase
MYRIDYSARICAAHRIVGHTDEDGEPGKCARLHGHNYAISVTLWAGALTVEGFVIDFAWIKRMLMRWDHRTLLWDDDPLFLASEDDDGLHIDEDESIIRVPVNPTSENLARLLAEDMLDEFSVEKVRVRVSETATSRAEWTATIGARGGVGVPDA